jgi:hypothetical protein
MGTVTHVIEANRFSTTDLGKLLDRQASSKYEAIAELRKLLSGIACGACPGRVRRRVNSYLPTYALGQASGGVVAVSVTSKSTPAQLHRNQLQARAESGPHALVELDNILGQVVAGAMPSRVTLSLDNAATYREYAFGSLGLSFEPGDTPTAEQALWFREQKVFATAPRTASWTNRYPSGWGNADTPGAASTEPAWTADQRAPYGAAPLFDEADTNRYYEITAALATQRPIHDNTEFALALALMTTKDADTTQAIFGNSAETNVGFSVRYDTTADQILVRLHNGTSLIIDIATVAGQAVEGVVQRLVFCKRDHASLDDYELWHNGTRILNGTASGAFPGAVDGTSNARIGARGGAISWYDTGPVYELVGNKNYARGAELAAYLEMFYA